VNPVTPSTKNSRMPAPVEKAVLGACVMEPLKVMGELRQRITRTIFTT